VQENGELPANSDGIALDKIYRMDVELLKRCKLLFAVPTDKDPGTLVEIGLAIAERIPVVVYDPDRECANTMVIAGSDCYSDNLDTCLNAVFSLLSKTRHSPRD
jgi:nucleoside 2-deoxyribosyltransferase